MTSLDRGAHSELTDDLAHRSVEVEVPAAMGRRHGTNGMEGG
jgi:hypothetical protein